MCASLGVGAQLGGSVPAVEARHHDVERDHVGLERDRLGERILAVVRCVPSRALELQIDRISWRITSSSSTTSTRPRLSVTGVLTVRRSPRRD
jgi:hypothetical protein